MRYLFAVMAQVKGTVLAGPEEMTNINRFNDMLRDTGRLVMAAGVAEPDMSVVFDNRGGLGEVRQSSAVAGDLFMAGFWVIDEENQDTAYRLGAEASYACNRIVEVRPFLV